MTINNVECLLCHAVYNHSLLANPDQPWRCTRCGQWWDATRVEVVTDYQKRAKAEAATIATGAMA